MIKITWADLLRYMFYLLVFLLPVNLGLHFQTQYSFLHGLVIDYLIPTLFFQDIFIFLFIVCWAIEGSIKKVMQLKSTYFLVLLTVNLCFVSYFSNIPALSFMNTLRFVLYTLGLSYAAFLSALHIRRLYQVFVLSIVLVAILGIFQFLLQGSVFDNYLFLGEQVYNIGTYGVTKESIFGKTVVPAYGLFRHPNVFASFLTVALLLVFMVKEKSTHTYRWLFCLVILFTALLCTFSYISWFVLVFSLTVFFLRSHKLLISGLLLCVVYMLLPLAVPTLSFTDLHLSRRYALNVQAYNVSFSKFIYGTGLGTSIPVIDNVVFQQPVHNIFLLFLVETGILSFTFLLLALFSGVRSFSFASLVFLTLIILGMLDHYFFTIPQALALFWLSFYISGRQIVVDN